MRTAALLLAALAAAAPCRAIEPASNFRIEVASAAVTGLECRRRPFRMEWTRGVGQRYSRTAAEGFARSPDLRTVSLGICAMVLMAPLAVLAVPADLLAAPWRRECDFDLQVEGRLAGWGGGAAAGGGGRFRLSEPEPEFGSSDEIMTPLEIRPVRAAGPRRSASPD